eukprot:TRINITY_DN88069_c0_g1_i1.p1 TRINITY_DN88069_c0_g1~~TRINITY_DN88069_c0_g1_i1.p1  ORF type:complete len:348 (+),score=47.83 TRINITY_DN88069_c0_g1_i1:62-1105(+)
MGTLHANHDRLSRSGMSAQEHQRRAPSSRSCIRQVGRSSNGTIFLVAGLSVCWCFRNKQLTLAHLEVPHSSKRRIFLAHGGEEHSVGGPGWDASMFIGVGIDPEKALDQHNTGYDPDIEVMSSGTGELFAARSTLRIRLPADSVFRMLVDPWENKRVFGKHVVSVNFRNLLAEDPVKRLRLFEVSKTGEWWLLGAVRLKHESTVIVEEDWRQRQVRYTLSKSGQMRRFAGAWHVISLACEPSNKDEGMGNCKILREGETLADEQRLESLVVHYHEAVLAFAMPRILRPLSRKVVRTMGHSLLHDLQVGAESVDVGSAHLAPNWETLRSAAIEGATVTERDELHQTSF